jgi:hypothetical protein
VNLAAYAMKGNWPIDGGLLNQSAWFFQFTQTLESTQNKIDNERLDRLSNG